MVIYVLGLNHRTAPIELRERVAFLTDEAREACQQLRADGTVAEIAILSTCNRTELYTITDDLQKASDAQIELIRRVKDVDLGGHAATYLHRQRDCVEHLFRVAGGIDSMVLGEPEILGQVKDAFELATEIDSTGAVLGKLFPSAFRVGKRSRSETGIGRGAVSLAKAGLQLAEKIFGDLERRNVLVIGAGDIAEGVVMLLSNRPLSGIVVANRTVERAEALASKFGGTAIPLDGVPAALEQADVIITAVSTAEPILDRTDLQTAMEARKGTRLVIDLGVPRNVAAEAGKLKRVFLYAVDDLQELVNLNLGRRRQEIPAVETIVADETDRFFDWLTALSTKGVVRELREDADRVRREAIEKLGRLSPEEEAIVQKFSMQFMNKMLHSPTVSLRRCDPGTPRGIARIEWTRRLFGLGKDEGSPDETEPKG